MRDWLSDARWSCASTPPDALSDPERLPDAGLRWRPATVPGTAAGALREAGEWEWGQEDEALLDGCDWWFTTTFARPEGAGPWDLRLGGLATLADVWINGRHVCHSENMFVSHVVASPELADDNALVIRCAALTPQLVRRHPRPRFKSRLVRHQALRFHRTTLLGRMPGWSRWAAPVGPWRPVTLRARPAHGRLEDVRITARCRPDGGGEVKVALALRGASDPPRSGTLLVGEQSVALTLRRESEDCVVASGELVLAQVERWWPHTLGAQPLYPVVVELDGARHELRQVGFRTVTIDRRDGAFTLSVNGVPCFCRGVTWGAIDVVTLTASDDEVARDVALARAANVDMIRLGGYGVYEDEAFWDACDVQGIMVWQDCMIAAVDPPDDPAFVESLRAELREQFGRLQGRPSLVAAAGSSESYQQGSMLGLPSERYRSPVLEQTVPELIDELVGEIAYVPSTPSGGDPPIRCDVGVAHYFGVGAYLRPLADAQLAGVRFAAECLSFANPPERETIRHVYGSAAVAGHDPRWKLAVAHDAGTSWDFEDVRDHYVRELFSVDPLAVRYEDPELALDLGRAAIVHLAEAVLGGWRRADCGCAGALVLAWRDLWPGAGWGAVDALGEPKALYRALARSFAARTVRLCDRGLNGLAVDVFNDSAQPLRATLRLSVHGVRGGELDAAQRDVELAPHGQLTLDAVELLGGFWDLTTAYRFTPREHDAVRVTLTGPEGMLLGRDVHLPGGPARPRSGAAGLSASARAADEGWTLDVTADGLATFVAVDVPGMRVSDAWFHLVPGETVALSLRGEGPPEGEVRALNRIASARIVRAAT